MSKKWYEKPMRIAALQCNFEEGKTLEVADRWRDMGFNTEQLFHPMADGYSALFDEEKNGPLLREYLAYAHKNGLRIILYLNIHILGPSIEHHYTTWAQQTKDGSFPKFYDTYYACCLNSPWRDYFFSSLKSLEQYDIDGIFLDGPVNVAGGCFCSYCKEVYRSRNAGKDLPEGPMRKEFDRETASLFFHEAYKLFKTIKPDGIFYMNMPITHLAGSSLFLPDLLTYNDIAGTEGGFMFYGPPKNAFLWKTSFAAKLLEAVAPQKPRVIFMAADQKPWSQYLHTPVETQLCIATTVANGANIWYGFHGPTKHFDSPSGDAAKDIIQRLKKDEEYYTCTASASRIGLFYSFATLKQYAGSMEASDFYDTDKGAAKGSGNYTESLNAFCDMLSRSSIPYDLVTDFDLSQEKLEPYDLLLLPTCACLSDETITLLKSFVHRGGNLVATFDTSLYDEEGNCRKDFGLSDLFGLSFSGKEEHYSPFDYCSLRKEQTFFSRISASLFPSPEYGLKILPKEGAEVLAMFHTAMAGRYVPLTEPDLPAIVLNKYGKGSSLYFAGTFGEKAFKYGPVQYREFVEQAVWHFAKPMVRLEKAVNVELILRTQPERLLIHLVNYAGAIPRPFEAILPQYNIEVVVEGISTYTKAQTLSDRAFVPIEREGKSCRIRIPRLNTYEVLVLESEESSV
ncbi:MAG: beta-galactosidase trimerization domain-containing protein [Candidatus Ratteibacteria bacterium]|jgi:hypothetical protein